MGWASSVVSPPDGDVGDFMTSCRKLRARNWRVFHPGHGGPITDPAARIDWLIDHRLNRETAILDALRKQPATPGELATRVYTDIPSELLGMATRNVLAHLIDLTGRNMIKSDIDPSREAIFRRI
ncbi:unnamed protein product [Ectocarpus sp. 12 AP-2014]